MADLVSNLQPFIEGRGNDYCRGCFGKNLFSALDLGELPIANELLETPNEHLDKFPLHLKVCVDCSLGQVADVVTPERIFRDYRYLSSMSTTFLEHAAKFVIDRVDEGSISPGDWVLEIASNDGYLLRNFLPFGIKCIGVEPAENVAQISRDLGVPTISEFFSSHLAIDLLARHGYPRLIIANNVMAHVPDLVDFVRGLSILCGKNTQISIENPSLANILIGMQFDTIYHEHYSYLSTSAVEKLSKAHNLHLYKVEELRIHGGSNRYWLQIKNGKHLTDTSVARMIGIETKNKLFDPNEWNEYSAKVTRLLEQFQEWLQIGKMNGKEIYGYGAAAKASTILNSIDIQGSIVAIADASLEKQRRFMPPNGIKIISPEELFMNEPTDIVIFPWNIKTEIASSLRANLDEQVNLWCAIPEMRQVEI